MFRIKFIKHRGFLTQKCYEGDIRMTNGRCMKCKKEVEIKDAKTIVMKNGMEAVQGVCPNCGTKVFRILGKKK